MLKTKIIVFACVSFETYKIVNPCIERKADEIHLFHYVKNPEQYQGTVYQGFYDRVESMLRSTIKGVRIVEHRVPIYDYITVQREIDDTIRDIRSEVSDSRIFLLASAGSDEYIGAVYCAAHQFENIDVLTASTKQFTVPPERIRELYYSEDNPVGLTLETYPSKIIPIYDLSADDMNLLQCFQLHVDESDSVHPDLSYYHLYEIINERGLWKGTPHEDRNNIKVSFKRVYMDRWLAKGWVVRKDDGDYPITERGRSALHYLRVKE